MKHIKVILADDNRENNFFIAEILKKTPDIKVVSQVNSGNKLISIVKQLKPHIIIMGVKFNDLSPVDVTEQIMAFSPTPILVVSNNKLCDTAKIAFESVCAGAIDVVEKKDINTDLIKETFHMEIIEKIRIASKVHVIKRSLPQIKTKIYNIIKEKNPFNKPRSFFSQSQSAESLFVVGIGASTGGPMVLYDLINRLPNNFGFSVLIVQHIVSSFLDELVSWIRHGTKKNVKLAKHNEILQKNTCYVAPGNHHMTVSAQGVIKLNDNPPYNCHKPSATVLFQSLAKHVSKRSIGVILTGMGSDGLDGLVDMHEKGIPIIAQDEKSSAIFGMPKACIDRGLASSVVSNERISAEIMYYYSKCTGGKQ